MHILTIRELLALRGLDLNQKIKLVRHKHKEQSIAELRCAGLFDAYQAIQSAAVFECDVIVAFEALEAGTQAKLIGVHQVESKRPAVASDIPTGLRGLQFKEGDIHYQLRRLDAFDALSDRVVIDWGNSALAWHQWLNDGKGTAHGIDKPVVGLQEAGSMGSFPGYSELLLSFTELRRLMAHPTANPDWLAKLQAVKAVYLIQHRQTGQLYVGSAAGALGLWGRWSDYVQSGHGGNIGLQELLSHNPQAHHDFLFSVLRVLPWNASSEEILRSESLEKSKLGTRVHGLTRN